MASQMIESPTCRGGNTAHSVHAAGLWHVRPAAQGGVQGRVRTWVAWPEAGLLLLNMRDNRWCANVGRAHRSNGIFYVVDLQARTRRSSCFPSLLPAVTDDNKGTLHV